MKTIPYNFIPEYPIKKGNMYYFGQLWNGNGGDEVGKELLLSESVSQDNEHVVSFTYDKIEENICDTVVTVTDIY